MLPPRLPPLLLLLLTTTAPLTTAQNAGLPDPDSRCTVGLCRPIGEIMASCIGGDATPESITWDEMVGGGNNITVNGDGVSVDMPKRLQCFCQSPGLEKRLDNCNGCYVSSNQEEYWSTGINNIKIVCGFTQPSSASSGMVRGAKKAGTAAAGIAVGVGLSLAVADVFRISI